VKLTQSSAAGGMTLVRKTLGTLERSVTKRAKRLATPSAAIPLGAADTWIVETGGGWTLDLKGSDGVKLGKSPKMLPINDDEAALQ
jgi:hypothetical protein